jgi:hypothetical protein
MTATTRATPETLATSDTPATTTTTATTATTATTEAPATITTPVTPETPGTSAVPAAPTIPGVSRNLVILDAATAGQRLRAVDTLLADPEAIPDPLEVELYAYREQITGETVG